MEDVLLERERGGRPQPGTQRAGGLPLNIALESRWRRERERERERGGRADLFPSPRRSCNSSFRAVLQQSEGSKQLAKRKCIVNKLAILLHHQRNPNQPPRSLASPSLELTFVLLATSLGVPAGALGSIKFCPGTLRRRASESFQLMSVNEA